MGRRYQAKGLAGLLRNHGKAAGVHFSAHDMRRTFATELADRDVGLEVIQVALGHASLETTRDYVQVKERRLREAMYGYQGAVCAEIGGWGRAMTMDRRQAIWPSPST